MRLVRQKVCSSTSSSYVLRWTPHIESRGPLPASMSGSCMCYYPRVFALRITRLGSLVAGIFSIIWVFHSSPTTSKHCPRFQQKLVDARYRLVLQLGRQLCRKGWLRLPAGKRVGTNARHVNLSKPIQSLQSDSKTFNPIRNFSLILSHLESIFDIIISHAVRITLELIHSVSSFLAA